VFILAIGVPRATSRGAFVGLIGGMAAVGAVATFLPQIAFLWHNVVGVVAVLVIGLLVSLSQRKPD
jgi:Na+/proline symporter